MLSRVLLLWLSKLSQLQFLHQCLWFRHRVFQ
jgi:hypothetical protein